MEILAIYADIYEFTQAFTSQGASRHGFEKHVDVEKREK